LLKRPVRNKLPQANHIDPVAEIVRERDSSQKLKMKAHADNKAYVKPCNISPGESVLVKRPFSVSKGGTVYDPIPMTVVSKKGSMITVAGENRTVTRNSSFFKNVHQPAASHGNDESQDSGLLQGVRPRPLNLLLNHHCADQPGSEFPERFWTCSLSLN